MIGYDFTGVPPHLIEGLTNWLAHGILPGGFLRAVIANDWLDACLRADELSLEGFSGLARFIANGAPAGAFGSPTCLVEWPLYLQALYRQAEEAASHV